ncbi:anti-sigma factor family protein [Clavibacter zhangzhiyongii]|uniref:anti-sigma factor family protein n=1 Tax=Clavibacter zhangzhiyongii TaxID=2768071 RepID=UPI0039DFB919
MNDRADDIHEWDAAYVLGSLSATDRALFEAHLTGCDACTRSLADLAGLPGVLRMLPVEDALALLEEPEAPAVPQPAPEPQGRPAPLPRTASRAGRPPHAVGTRPAAAVPPHGRVDPRGRRGRAPRGRRGPRLRAPCRRERARSRIRPPPPRRRSPRASPPTP